MGASVMPTQSATAVDALANTKKSATPVTPLPGLGAVNATPTDQAKQLTSTLQSSTPSSANQATSPAASQQQDTAGIVPVSAQANATASNQSAMAPGTVSMAAPLPSTGAVTPAPVQQNAGGFQTAPLISTANGGNMTPYGDAANSYRGLVTDQGGGFGGFASADAKAAATKLESITGVPSAQFGDLSGMTAAQIDDLTRQMGLIGNRDPVAIQAGLQSTNPLVKQTAERYAAENAPAQNVDPGGGAGVYDPTLGRAVRPGDPEFLDSLQRLDPARYTAITGQQPTATTSPIAGNWTPADPTQYAGPEALPDVLKGPQTSALPSVGPVTGPASSTVPAGATVATTPASVSAPSTSTSSAPSGSVATTPTDPNNALTAQTIARAPGVDRFKLAQDQVNAWNDATQPQYEADERDATRRAAGKGQLNSGMLRTAYGNLALARDTQRNAQEKNYLTDALQGTIADQFGDVGIAQQQQGFQSGQQQNAFSQALQQATTEDSLTGNSFERALQAAMFGYQGNPADTQLALAGDYGKQAAGAGTAAGQYGQATSASAAGASPYDALIKQIIAQYGGGSSPAPAPATSSPDYIPGLPMVN